MPDRRSSPLRDFFDLSSKVDGLQTGRVVFREASPADAGPLFDATRNPEFNRLLVWPRPDSLEQVQQRMEAICLAHSRGRMTAVSACLRETGAWVGLFRVMPYGQDPEITEFGLWIHPNFWRASLAKEISRACIAQAFSLPEVHTMLAAALPANKAVLAGLTTLGFSFADDVIRHHEDGHPVDVVEYRLTRDAWSAHQRAAAEAARPETPAVSRMPG
jgi:RimJ/RimL family protein N-acetyltransferase